LVQFRAPLADPPPGKSAAFVLETNFPLSVAYARENSDTKVTDQDSTAGVEHSHKAVSKLEQRHCKARDHASSVGRSDLDPPEGQPGSQEALQRTLHRTPRAARPI